MNLFSKILVSCLAVVCLFIPNKALSQIDAQLTQYWATQSYYNPAAIGLTDFIHITGGSRMQWVGIDNAPKIFLGLADMPLKLGSKRIGVGVNVSQQTYGLYKSLNAGAQIAYKMKMLGGSLSIGVQLGLINQTFKGTDVVLPEGGEGQQTNDEGIPETDITGSAFDAGVGLYFTHKYFWLALSATHLNNANVTLKTGKEDDTSLYEFNAGRTFYFMAGGNIPIKNTLFELQPSVFFKTDTRFFQAEATARVRYRKFISAGVGYRWKDAVSLMVGVDYKNFFVGYSYDYCTSSLSRGTSGSHEIIVSYNVKLNLTDKNKNKHKSIRIM